ncbi:peptidyl-tRNA hydrolase-like, partial [Pecten maximus]|uniref:peptidyl-tRNA hydrolase-like n=1 Tax=Pecten maximus TaxID=6579 RepID=UPI001458349C
IKKYIVCDLFIVKLVFSLHQYLINCFVCFSVRHYNIDTDKVYLMHDDLDRALGKVSIKEGGSASGHNGVKSVQGVLGSEANKIFKVRVGIGRPSSRDEVIEYVLHNFTQEESAGVQEGVRKALQSLTWHLQDRGEDVLLLTNLYGINPKILQRIKKIKNLKARERELSNNTDLGMSKTCVTESEEHVQSTDKHLHTASGSHLDRNVNVPSMDKQKDTTIHRTHSQEGEVTIGIEVKRMKGE